MKARRMTAVRHHEEPTAANAGLEEHYNCACREAVRFKVRFRFREHTHAKFHRTNSFHLR
jgi:hypothetical protein